MHAISREFIETMQENDFYLTKENIFSHFENMARIYRESDDPNNEIFNKNLKDLHEDQDLIISELKDLFEE